MFKVEARYETATYFETASDVAQYIIDNAEAWDEYDCMIRDCYGDVEVMGLTYDPATVLERVDPVAYRCGYSDWMDCNYEDIRIATEELAEDDSIEWFGYTISVENRKENSDDNY